MTYVGNEVKNGKIIYKKHISRVEVRLATMDVFVFGDNMEQRGLGGQAAEMRGEPNAVGVPTKWRPSMDEDAFFSDRDVLNRSVIDAIESAFIRLKRAILEGRNVVLPADGIGTGMAQLRIRAPLVAAFIAARQLELERLAAW
jgi:RecJ-like exonuclease